MGLMACIVCTEGLHTAPDGMEGLQSTIEGFEQLRTALEGMRASTQPWRDSYRPRGQGGA